MLPEGPWGSQVVPSEGPGFYVCPWWWCWNADIMFLMTLGSKVHISLGLFTGTVLRLDSDTVVQPVQTHAHW